jgi:broad specificity phosphatase PhoE
MDQMSHVYFIRHAATDMAGTFCGHSDPDVNHLGATQIVDLVSSLSTKHIAMVYSSDLKRAQATASAIAKEKGIPCELHPALREIYFGQWEGLTWEEIERADPDYAGQWLANFPDLPAPSGEDFRAFESRVLKEVTQLLQENNHRPIAVVSHAGVLRIVLKHLFGYSAEDARIQTRTNCCIFDYEHQRASSTALEVCA